MQLMARLAALVPPPRHPLLRFDSAFAPNSPWRKHVVPLVPPRPWRALRDEARLEATARTSTYIWAQKIGHPAGSLFSRRLVVLVLQ
jgi:hypothetical protein